MTISEDAWIPPVAKRALNLLTDQCNELEDRNRDLAGHLRTLSEAISDIEDIAEDNLDLDAHSWNAVWHICNTQGGVRAARAAVKDGK